MLLVFIGCSAKDLPWCEDCNDSINDRVAASGPPDDATSYEADNYWTVTYWYWCLGLAFTWTQDGCDCEESTYTFAPICP